MTTNQFLFIQYWNTIFLTSVFIQFLYHLNTIDPLSALSLFVLKIWSYTYLNLYRFIYSLHGRFFFWSGWAFLVIVLIIKISLVDKKVDLQHIPKIFADFFVEINSLNTLETIMLPIPMILWTYYLFELKRTFEKTRNTHKDLSNHSLEKNFITTY